MQRLLLPRTGALNVSLIPQNCTNMPLDVEPERNTVERIKEKIALQIKTDLI